MKSKTEVILIYRQDPLPYHGIGSRTELYKRYIESENHLIDHIICPKPKIEPFKNLKYHYLKPNTGLQNKILSKVKSTNPITNIVLDIVKPNTNYIIKILDDTGLVVDFHKLYQSGKLNKEQVKIVFFYHGFELMLNGIKKKSFIDTVSHVIYLTKLSYQFNKLKFNVFPPTGSVIHNGIDTNKFTPLKNEEQSNFKSKLNLNHEDPIFMWCSQDRPKKGIDLTLQIWTQVLKKYKNAKLLIVGIDREIKMDGVINIGKVPNQDLPKYYQIADVYLFTTLCKEGFGLTLIEALHCGCYCIASDYGGVSEVLEFGKYGKLIKHPHFHEEWLQAIDEYFNNPLPFDALPQSKYSAESWISEMNTLLTNIKSYFY